MSDELSAIKQTLWHHDHQHNFVPWILDRDGYMAWEHRPTPLPRYPFQCTGCGDFIEVTVSAAAAEGLIVLRDD